MTTVFETEKTAIWLKKDSKDTERRVSIDKKTGYASCWWQRRKTEEGSAVEPEMVLGCMLTGGGVRYDYIVDGKIDATHRRDLISVRKATTTTVMYRGYETTDISQFGREYWQGAEYPTPEELTAIGKAAWEKILAGAPRWHRTEFAAARAVPSVLNSVTSTAMPDASEEPLETAMRREVEMRKHQDLFRRKLEAVWGNQCAVTDVRCRECLVASHIKPWAVCTDEEKLDPCNGFLLNVALDALFDAFLITFDADGRIRLSRAVDEGTLRALGIRKDMRLRTPFDFEKSRRYLQYHWSEFEKRNRG